jgi:hypothetical protein
MEGGVTTATDHVHHWKLEPPGADGRSWGECQDCHETKWHGSMDAEDGASYNNRKANYVPPKSYESAGTPPEEAAPAADRPLMVSPTYCKECGAGPLLGKGYIAQRLCGPCMGKRSLAGRERQRQKRLARTHTPITDDAALIERARPIVEAISARIDEPKPEPPAVRVYEEAAPEDEPDFLTVRMMAEGIDPRLYELYLSYQKELDDKRLRYIDSLIAYVDQYEIIADAAQDGVVIDPPRAEFLDRIERLLGLDK